VGTDLVWEHGARGGAVEPRACGGEGVERVGPLAQARLALPPPRLRCLPVRAPKPGAPQRRRIFEQCTQRTHLPPRHTHRAALAARAHTHACTHTRAACWRTRRPCGRRCGGRSRSGGARPRCRRRARPASAADRAAPACPRAAPDQQRGGRRRPSRGGGQRWGQVARARDVRAARHLVRRVNGSVAFPRRLASASAFFSFCAPNQRQAQDARQS